MDIYLAAELYRLRYWRVVTQTDDDELQFPKSFKGVGAQFLIRFSAVYSSESPGISYTYAWMRSQWRYSNGHAGVRGQSPRKTFIRLLT
jgi:hypothetical protein